MAQSDGTKYQPSCMLAHHIVNRLAVIVGYCDLLAEELSAEEPDKDSKRGKRLRIMRDIANSTAEELSQHQCRVDAITRIEVTQNPLRPH